MILTERQQNDFTEILKKKEKINGIINSNLSINLKNKFILEIVLGEELIEAIMKLSPEFLKIGHTGLIIWFKDEISVMNNDLEEKPILPVLDILIQEIENLTKW